MNREDLIAPANYNIIQELEQFAADPVKLAIKWENQQGETKEITYKQLIRNANKIGNVFKMLGLTKGDKILVMFPRLIEAYEVYVAALKLGIVLIPSSEMLKTRDLQYRIEHGDVKGIISYYSYVDQFNMFQMPPV